MFSIRLRSDPRAKFSGCGKRCQEAAASFPPGHGNRLVFPDCPDGGLPLHRKPFPCPDSSGQRRPRPADETEHRRRRARKRPVRSTGLCAGNAFVHEDSTPVSSISFNPSGNADPGMNQADCTTGESRSGHRQIPGSISVPTEHARRRNRRYWSRLPLTITASPISQNIPKSGGRLGSGRRAGFRSCGSRCCFRWD